MKNKNYTQLSMFDIVFDHNEQDIPKDIDGGKTETLAAVSNTENNNLCPYRVPTIEEIVKMIDKAAYGTDRSKLLSDVFECGAIAISNLLDLIQKDEREKRYTEIMNNYKPQDRTSLCVIFSKIYALCSSVVYDDGVFNDYLGELFMRLNQGNKHNGQFFTPYHISDFMAKCSLLPDVVKEKIQDDGILTISDPCSGGGGLMLACLSELKRLGVNYGRNCFVACSDIDIRCVHMTYLQLSLAGVPAIVKHQNSLSRETWSIWRTPALMLQYPRFVQFDI